MKKITWLLLLLWLFAPLVQAQTGLEITLRQNSEQEQQTKLRLEKLLQEYNLAKWLFTKKIVIDQQADTPYSHPVLTLNTKGLKRDVSALLASFLHEQLHWFASARLQQTNKAKADLKAIFPAAPDGPPEGANDLDSTYLHLIVCYLEYEGLKELMGEAKAQERIKINSQYFYKWVYRTVLNEGTKIKAVLNAHRLKI
jgi:hypothetical protein